MTLLGSAAYFGFGGFFAASLTNALRGYPVLRSMSVPRAYISSRSSRTNFIDSAQLCRPHASLISLDYVLFMNLVNAFAAISGTFLRSPAEPQMHLAYSVVGAVVGYGFYSLESTHNKSASALKEKHEALLAGQYTEVKAQLGEETHH